MRIVIQILNNKYYTYRYNGRYLIRIHNDDDDDDGIIPLKKKVTR